MPAVSVEDISKIPVLPLSTNELGGPRKVAKITTAPAGLEGEGFPVRRAFAGISMADLDPFVHMDQMGEVNYAPGEPKGTPWHPHRGFETVTYMIDGTFEHQDSIGGGGLITNGGTQWMTAGSGILHIERPPEKLVASGGLFHGIQLWVNLPSVEKWVDPHYQDLEPTDVTLVASRDGGALVRVIAGDLGREILGPGTTHTPITMLHATIQPQAQLQIPWPKDFNALIYVLSGEGKVGGDAPLHEGQLAVCGHGGSSLLIEAGVNQSAPLEALILGGKPIGEPVAAYGPFVMNTREEIAQAFEDFEAGKLGSIPNP